MRFGGGSQSSFGSNGTDQPATILGTKQGHLYEAMPLGSKDPNNKVLEPKYYNINGIWALKTLLFGSLDPEDGLRPSELTVQNVYIR